MNARHPGSDTVPVEGQHQPAIASLFTRSPRQRDRHEPRMVPQPQRRLRARVAGLDGGLPEVPRAAVPLPPAPRLHRPGLRRAIRARVGPGQRFVTTERLQAGGAYTVRGYDDVTLELLAGQRAPTGRTSLLVLNQEIRFPLVPSLPGRDVLWTTPTSSARSICRSGEESRLRDSVGGGIRFVLPFLLLRVDYGYPLKKDRPTTMGAGISR